MSPPREPTRSRAASRDGAGGSPASLPDFERSVDEVERIIQRIERGEIGLEQSIVEYERGVELLARCREVLARAEQRVDDLTAQMQRELRDGAGGGPRGATTDDDAEEGADVDDAPEARG